jgi:hypothetical protein
MLWNKLLGSTAAAGPQAPAIQYVGGYVQGVVGTAANVTIPLTSLTGGLATAPAAGDIVIVYFATGSTVNRNLVVAGYTVVADLYADDTYDTNLEVAYKINTGSLSDTSITLTGGTFSTADAGTVAIQVFRGEFNTYGISNTNATGANGGRPNPASITPTVEGSVVVAGGASAHNGGTLTFTSSDLTDFITAGANGTYDSTVGMGYHQWVSGAFDPAQFGGGTTSTAASWAAVTMLLPTLLTTPGFISFSLAQNAGEPTSATISRPTSVQEGDLLIAFVINGGTEGFGAVPTGWARRSSTSSRLLATKVVTAAEPSSYSFPFDTGDSSYSGTILCFRSFNYDLVSTASVGITPRANSSYVLGFPASSSVSISFSQASFFEENKLVVDADASSRSLTVFGKSGVSAEATGAIGFTPADTGAFLMSLKPAFVGPAVRVIATNAVENLALPVPAHNAGDWLVVVRGNQAATPPALLSGYTDLGTFVADTSLADRAARVQYIVSDGTITSVSSSFYNFVAVIRGASSVGQSAFSNTTVVGTSTTRTLPALTGLTTGVGNLILGGSYPGTVASGSNYDFLPNFGMQITGPTPSDISDATVTFSSNIFNSAFAIEFLP